MTIQFLVRQVESSNPEVLESPDWLALKRVITELVPVLVPIQIGRKYTMSTKKGRVNMQVTKENDKTWVMYELEDSSRPGCRWMISKSWCKEDNLQPITTEAMIPFGVKTK